MNRLAGLRPFLAARFKGTPIGDLMVLAYQAPGNVARFVSRPGRLVSLKARQFSCLVRYSRDTVKSAARWLYQSRETANFVYDLTELNKLYLAHALAIPLGCSVDRVRGLFREAEEDEHLRSHLTTRDCQPFFARRLVWYAVARHLKPKTIVETGVDRGLGSVLLCAALLRNAEDGSPGRYIGLDILPGAGALLCGIYAGVGRIVYGDSLDTLARIDAPIDLFINDSDHAAEHERCEYRIVVGKMSKGAIIVGDNVHATTELAKFSEETGRHFICLSEMPKDHWYPGAAAGVSWPIA